MVRRLAFLAAAISVTALAGYAISGQGARAAGSNPDAFSIDMNPAGPPGNTATSLGTREACARINENDVLDADEDVTVDTVTVDVTVTNIPASDSMIAFNYVLNYNENRLTVQDADHSFLLLANNPSGSLLSASEPLPDTDGSGDWSATELDINIAQPEYGSGVLSRLAISSDPGPMSGTYPLILTQAAIIDPLNDANPPDNAVDTNGDGIGDTVAETPSTNLAVNEACAVVQGDVDCSGSVLSTDALKLLRHIAGLSVSQQPDCPGIGTGNPFPFGDVDCSGTVLSTDALKVLRFTAGLSVAQAPGCTLIGE